MSAADRLNEIEARANAATEGPWEAYRPNPAYRIYEICSTTPQGLDETLAEVSGYDDAEFMAHARADVPALVAALRAVHQIAFDPDIVSALEHGVVRDGPGVGVGISAPEAMGYAVEALRDIRAAIEEALR